MSTPALGVMVFLVALLFYFGILRLDTRKFSADIAALRQRGKAPTAGSVPRTLTAKTYSVSSSPPLRAPGEPEMSNVITQELSAKGKGKELHSMKYSGSTSDSETGGILAGLAAQAVLSTSGNLDVDSAVAFIILLIVFCHKHPSLAGPALSTVPPDSSGAPVASLPPSDSIDAVAHSRSAPPGPEHSLPSNDAILPPNLAQIVDQGPVGSSSTVQDAPVSIPTTALRPPERIPEFGPYWITPAPSDVSANKPKVTVPEKVANLIVDHVEEGGARIQNLSSLSLVSKAFYPRTRKHLFSEIDIQHEYRLIRLCILLDSQLLIQYGGILSHVSSFEIAVSGVSLHKEHGCLNGGRLGLSRLLRDLCAQGNNLRSFCISIVNPLPNRGDINWMALTNDMQDAFLNCWSLPSLRRLDLKHFINMPLDFLAESSIRHLEISHFGLQDSRTSRSLRRPITKLYPPSLQSVSCQESFALLYFLRRNAESAEDGLMTSNIKRLSMEITSDRGLEEMHRAMCDPVLSNVQTLAINWTNDKPGNLTYLDLARLPHVKYLELQVSFEGAEAELIKRFAQVLRVSVPSTALESLNITMHLDPFSNLGDGLLQRGLSRFHASNGWGALQDVLMRTELRIIPALTLTINIEIERDGDEGEAGNKRFALWFARAKFLLSQSFSELTAVGHPTFKTVLNHRFINL